MPPNISLLYHDSVPPYSLLHSIQCNSLFRFKERSFKMRYESFYPFARNQSSPPPPREQGIGFHPFSWTRASTPRASRPSSTACDPFANWAGPSQFSARSTYEATPGAISGQGPSKMEAYMQTADKFLNTAQQFAPVVQQIAPMMRNLPAMWKLYKGFQSLPLCRRTTNRRRSALHRRGLQHIPV